MSSIVHDFRERLEWSAHVSDEPAWIDLYRSMWPDLLSCVRLDGRSEWQLHGVDRLLVLKNGKQILIDEKKRSKDFGDALLEIYSVCDFDEKARRVTGYTRLGWAVDPGKVTDYIVYAVPTAGKAFLLPYELLRQTTVENMQQGGPWQRFPSWYPKAAKNATYWTVSVAVPWIELRDAMWRTSQRQFGSAVPLPKPLVVHGGQLVFNWSVPCRSQVPQRALPGEIGP